MATLRREDASATLVNLSMLLYMVWLLLPAVQTTLRAVTGVVTVGLFGVGALLDAGARKARLVWLVPRVLLCVLLPLALFFLLERGGGNLPAYLVQQGMFWFPLLWSAYARKRGDARCYRLVAPLLLTLLTITTLTTLGWLIQGLLRGDKVYAYARSLGSGAEGNEAYLKELMGRNIGGYDFIYASVLLLPVVFYMAAQASGMRRAGFASLYVLQLCMIGLSQYTYAILMTAALTAVMLLGALLRLVFRRLSTGTSMLWSLLFIAGLWLFRMPLLAWASQTMAAIGFANAHYSLEQLRNLLSGGAVDAGSRLATYTLPLSGIAASPLFGSMLGGQTYLGMHSDLLDLLSGLGLIGTAAFALAAWFIGRGAAKGARRLQAAPYLVLQGITLLVCLTLGTVFYSREIPLVICLTYALFLQKTNPTPIQPLSVANK